VTSPPAPPAPPSTPRVRLTDPWRGLLLAAALILAGTAILHVLYYPRLSSALSAAPVGDTWGPQLEGLWLMFSVNLAIIAVFLAVAALRTRMASDSGLFVCALILAANTGLLGAFMGLFAGTLLVGISAVLVIVARMIRQVSLAA
jgi:hypothetical protein